MRKPPLHTRPLARVFKVSLLWLVYLWIGAGFALSQEQDLIIENAKAKAQARLQEILSTVDALNQRIASLHSEGGESNQKHQQDLLRARQSLLAESNQLDGALNRLNQGRGSAKEIDEIIGKSGRGQTFSGFGLFKLLLILLPVAIWLIIKKRKSTSSHR